jgi:hypothetical protein
MSDTTTDARLGSCRACDASIRWARNIATGKGIPLDPDPVAFERGARGLFAAATPDEIADSGTLVKSGEVAVYMLRQNDEPPAGTACYITHFATCPDAETFRKPKSR